MRELKFRAYQDGVWLFSGTSLNADLSRFFGRLFGHAKIMQYTELTDKNGTDIYEGDILVDERNHGDFSNDVIIVEFQDGKFCYKNYGTLSDLVDIVDYCEVTGNIYDL